MGSPGEDGRFLPPEPWRCGAERLGRDVAAGSGIGHVEEMRAGVILLVRQTHRAEEGVLIPVALVEEVLERSEVVVRETGDSLPVETRRRQCGQKVDGLGLGVEHPELFARQVFPFPVSLFGELVVDTLVLEVVRSSHVRRPGHRPGLNAL